MRIGCYAEGNVTVYVRSELARLGAPFRIPIDLLRSAGLLLSGEEDAASIGKPANVGQRPPVDRRKGFDGAVAAGNAQ